MRLIVAIVVVVLPGTVSAQDLRRKPSGAVEITITDKATGKPVACRLHVKDAAGKPQRAAQLPFWRDHFVCPATVSLDLAAGEYTYECERGP